MSNEIHVLTNGQIIDALDPEPRPGNIFVQSGRIIDISLKQSHLQRPNYVYDLKGKYVTPGLWDVHTHIGKGIPDHEAKEEMLSQRTIRAGINCREALKLSLIHI